MNLSLTVFDHFGTKMACQMVVSNYDVEESLLNISNMKCMKTIMPNYKGHTVIFLNFRIEKKTDWKVGATMYFSIHIQVMISSMAQHEDCYREFYLHRLNTAFEDVM